ncbi:unnamed protein product [Soboliphyme baturini]|uniref:GDP-fucose protein O-fucosyltransferase 1 n=1 Tax=Soboliphyme baturini TaxID=241478 RepID=A0A183J9I5_9BILA|nr:unnamed protein product [Soboliphyme baturini]
MRGAPASFPVTESDSHLQKYLEFSEKLVKELKDILKKYFNGKRDYVGIHLRNGEDWKNACDHAELAPKFMASYQCVGFDYHKKFTKDMCLPSKDLVLNLTRQIVLKETISNLYIATDKNPFLDEFKKLLPGVKVVHHNPHLPIVDIMVLSEARYFIGTCGSSFSSLVWRHRREYKKGPSAMFIADALSSSPIYGDRSSNSDEL